MSRLLLVVVLLLAPSVAAAQATHLVVVVGLGGDAEHRELFHGWAVQLVDAAVKGYGLPADNVHYLGEKTELDPSLIRARSTRENIESTVRTIAAAAAPTDQIVLVLIGHGSAQGGEGRFNLPGPDMGAADFSLLLDQFSDQTVALVNTASASGDFVQAVAAPGRTVITATRSAREQNETVFAGFFVEAFTGEDADLDKDGRVSLLEAFQYAAREVERHYADQDLLMTEHAQLDDDGDGEGSDSPVATSGDGMVAAALFLSARVPGTTVADAGPELRALYARRDSLEGQILELRQLRDTLETEDYEGRLEDLLVEMGLLTREIRALEEGGPP